MVSKNKKRYMICLSEDDIKNIDFIKENVVTVMLTKSDIISWALRQAKRLVDN